MLEYVQLNHMIFFNPPCFEIKDGSWCTSEGQCGGGVQNGGKKHEPPAAGRAVAGAGCAGGQHLGGAGCGEHNTVLAWARRP